MNTQNLTPASVGNRLAEREARRRKNRAAAPPGAGILLGVVLGAAV